MTIPSLPEIQNHRRIDRVFAADSFVMLPPAIVKPKDRLCLEAIAFAMRAIAHNLNTIGEITGKQRCEALPHMPEAELIGVFVGTWNTVDQLYNLRNLLQIFGDRKLAPPIETFIRKYEAVAGIRNDMEHLDKGLGNLAEKKKAMPTTFGSISYFKFESMGRNERGAPWVKGHMIVLPFGSSSHPRHRFPISNPAGRTITKSTSLFKLSAFGRSLDLDDLFDDIPALASNLEAIVRPQILKAAEQLSKETGKPIEELLRQPTRLVPAMDLLIGF